jgi:putative DNA primase/helicase
MTDRDEDFISDHHADDRWTRDFDTRLDRMTREVEAEAAVKFVKEITEDALARAFIDAHAGRLLYRHDGQPGWLLWRNTYWGQDLSREVFDMLREFVRAACARKNKKGRGPGGGSRFCLGIERFCQADRRVAVTADRFDQNDWLLGTPGGVVDLRSGEIRPASPDDYITRQTAVAPALRGTPCPLWDRFLDEATGGDIELIGFLRRFAGYALSGLTTEQCLLFIAGLGGNGKSVLINTIKKIMGTYATVAAMATFTSRFNDAHPEELASLDGARLVVASETKVGKQWDEVRIKSLTGGDTVRAHFMRQDSFTFTPKFKLMFVGNSTPELSHLDEAMRRRFHLAEFNHTPANPDKDLELKLEGEWPPILRWMIDGNLEWQEFGLRPPASVAETTRKYFDEQDVFGQWLKEHCDIEPGNPHKKEASARLYENWCAFARARQHEPGTMTGFGWAMRRHGLHSKQVKIFAGKGYEGVQLKQSQGWADQ